MRNKFSTLLLSGKAATLPMLLPTPAQAYTPSYTDILTPTLTQIELPVSGQVRLDSLGTPGSDVYNGAVYLCSGSTGSAIAGQLSLVVTGLRHGDAVYVAASKSLGGLEALDPRFRVGSTDSMITFMASVTATSVLPSQSLAASTGDAAFSMSVPLNLSKLVEKGFSLTAGSKFYLQTVALPPEAFLPASPISPTGGINWSVARYSEVDVVSVGACSTYGPHGSF